MRGRLAGQERFMSHKSYYRDWQLFCVQPAFTGVTPLLKGIKITIRAPLGNEV